MKFRVLLFLMLVLSSFSGNVFALTIDEAFAVCEAAKITNTVPGGKPDSTPCHVIRYPSYQFPGIVTYGGDAYSFLTVPPCPISGQIRNSSGVCECLPNEELVHDSGGNAYCTQKCTANQERLPITNACVAKCGIKQQRNSVTNQCEKLPVCDNPAGKSPKSAAVLLVEYPIIIPAVVGYELCLIQTDCQQAMANIAQVASNAVSKVIEQCKKPQTCDTQYPEYVQCSVLIPYGYDFNSKQSALNFFGSGMKTQAQQPVNSGPCVGTPNAFHWNVRGSTGSGRVGSITSCTCCTDTTNGPILKNKFMVF